MIVKTLLAATMSALLLGVSGCSGSSTDAEPETTESTAESTAEATAESTPAQPNPTDAAPSGEPVVLVIKDFAYSGAESVSPGATIEVRNEDRSTHSVTSEDGAFDEVIVEGNGTTGTFTAPTEPGTYTYVCKFHPEMEGTLVVE